LSDAEPDYVARNREHWTQNNAAYTDASARASWAKEEFSWGLWGVPESDVGALGEVDGLDVVELGCGTAYCSARLARIGAKVVGVDPTPAQLETARRMQAETGIEFPLVEAIAEDVPLPNGSFDLAISEYGASIWADPTRWLPEAYRLLRPGGRLVFLRGSTLMSLCLLEDEEATSTTLQRPQHGLRRVEWPDGVVEFLPGTGEMFRLVRGAGFEIEDFIELYAPDGAEAHTFYGYVTPDWGRQWPTEEIWVARKPRSEPSPG
jgi:SAM-dependent methyltransferase